ncbi:MAG: immunity 53 family protein [Leptospiraceae bacterium]|nr:immunity 53 family protein [Leptospiraceae bacterium]
MKMKSREETKTNLLNWLQNWFKEQCNGDREHNYGISIETLDNPGWKITIDLEETNWENSTLDLITEEISESDWFSYGVKDQKFIGAGDPLKLELLIEKFKYFVEK